MQLFGRTAEDGVEVGHVQLGEAEALDVRLRERLRVAGFDARTGDGPHRRIALAGSGARVHGAPGEQVHDADHPHDRTSAVVRRARRRTSTNTPKHGCFDER